MYYADLTPCQYNIPEPKGVSVGWLDKAHGFSRGTVPDGFVERLIEISKRPAVQHRRFHECEFCNFEPEPSPLDEVARLARFERQKAAGTLSWTVIRVLGREGKVYSSPALICHYVAKHGHKPPEDFVIAVMETDLTRWKICTVCKRETWNHAKECPFCGHAVLSTQFLEPSAGGSSDSAMRSTRPIGIGSLHAR